MPTPTERPDARPSSPDLHRAVLPKESVARLSRHLDDAVRAQPDLKSSVATLARNADLRPIAVSIVDWFWDSRIPELYRERTGEEPILLLEYTTIRRHTPGLRETRIAWHIDANFVGFDGAMCVAWVPVDPVGVAAPGLEFALPTSPVPRSTVERYWKEQLVGAKRTLSDDAVSGMYGGSPYENWRPAMDPGDLLMFDQWVVHRTDPGLDQAPRTAIEFRMFSLAAPPQRVARGDPILVAFRTPSGDWVARPAAELMRHAAARA